MRIRDGTQKYRKYLCYIFYFNNKLLDHNANTFSPLLMSFKKLNFSLI